MVFAGTPQTIPNFTITYPFGGRFGLPEHYTDENPI